MVCLSACSKLGRIGSDGLAEALSALDCVKSDGYGMRFTIETEREEDGRWIAEVVGLPGVMKYGQTRADAIGKAEALALRVLAERIEAGDEPLESIEIRFAAA